MGRNYASLTLSYSWEGFMQNMPPVTLGEELCKTCFEEENSVSTPYVSSGVIATLSACIGLTQLIIIIVIIDIRSHISHILPFV